MQNFSLTDAIRAVCAETWSRIRSVEWDASRSLTEQFGQPASDIFARRAPCSAI
jgi:hypothetical protein